MTVTDQRVIGAIGPLATMTDRQGAAVMLPLLQSAIGGPSDRLFCSEGLTTLGFATAVPA